MNRKLLSSYHDQFISSFVSVNRRLKYREGVREIHSEKERQQDCSMCESLLPRVGKKSIQSNTCVGVEEKYYGVMQRGRENHSIESFEDTRESLTAPTFLPIILNSHLEEVMWERIERWHREPNDSCEDNNTLVIIMIVINTKKLHPLIFLKSHEKSRLQHEIHVPNDPLHVYL